MTTEKQVFLSTTDLAARMRISARTLRRLVLDGAVPIAARVAGTPLFEESEVARALGVSTAELSKGLLTFDELFERRPDLSSITAARAAAPEDVRALRIGRQWRFSARKNAQTDRCNA